MTGIKCDSTELRRPWTTSVNKPSTAAVVSSFLMNFGGFASTEHTLMASSFDCRQNEGTYLESKPNDGGYQTKIILREFVVHHGVENGASSSKQNVTYYGTELWWSSILPYIYPLRFAKTPYYPATTPALHSNPAGPTAMLPTLPPATQTRLAY